MINVSVSDFLKLHGGLVRMLQALALADPAGLPTNQASLKTFNSRQYGNRILKRGVELGYIRRERASRQKGEGGHYYVMNYITPAGKALLQELEQ